MLSKDYPVSTLCAVLGLARSSYYYAPVAPDEVEVMRAMQEIAARFPVYGSRRLTQQLRRAPYHLSVNRKRVVGLRRT